jgi:hypothetical protein
VNDKSKEKMSATREIYRHSIDTVGSVLNLFGISRADGGYDFPSESDFGHIVELIDSIVEQHRDEEESPYRTTILAVGEWLQAALKQDYLDHQNNEGFPSIFYVVRKGVEVIHCLVHRDLRRKVLSGTESSVVHEFVALASQYPNPCEWQPPRKKHRRSS